MSGGADSDGGERGAPIAWTPARVVAGLVLLALHLEPLRPRRVVVWGDWLPEELGYRLLWTALAFAWLLWVLRPARGRGADA